MRAPRHGAGDRHVASLHGPGRLLHAAAALILAHNHPSGDPEPSQEDADITRRMHEAGKLLGIELLDHVVLAADGYTSLRERKLI